MSENNELTNKIEEQSEIIGELRNKIDELNQEIGQYKQELQNCRNKLENVKEMNIEYGYIITKLRQKGNSIELHDDT